MNPPGRGRTWEWRQQYCAGLSVSGQIISRSSLLVREIFKGASFMDLGAFASLYAKAWCSSCG